MTEESFNLGSACLPYLERAWQHAKNNNFGNCSSDLQRFRGKTNCLTHDLQAEIIRIISSIAHCNFGEVIRAMESLYNELNWDTYEAHKRFLEFKDREKSNGSN